MTYHLRDEFANPSDTGGAYTRGPGYEWTGETPYPLVADWSSPYRFSRKLLWPGTTINCPMARRLWPRSDLL